MDYSSVNAFILDEWYMSEEDVHALIVSFSMRDILGARIEFSQPHDVASACGLAQRIIKTIAPELQEARLMGLAMNQCNRCVELVLIHGSFPLHSPFSEIRRCAYDDAIAMITSNHKSITPVGSRRVIF